MNQKTIGVTIGFIVFVVGAYFIGIGDGKIQVCDSISSAFKDDSRMKAVAIDELGTQFLEGIRTECKW